METHPQSPQPPGDPRWVALFRQPDSDSWRMGAQSPHRAPVLYALGEMTHTVRARGQEPVVALWGPKDGGWGRYEAGTPEPAPQQTPVAATPEKRGSTSLAERMLDRRHQALMAGLSKAGLYDLTPDDVTALRAVVDGLDETTVRRVAYWLAVAGR
ncbi:hypothetical protein [Streptomyces sp. NPDC018693]|uniref:hypothetical protein n=1 Tax=unclassified Streptomyces TaxID=2593676 RepID=UPI00379FEC53